jgi:hypothetical protein
VGPVDRRGGASEQPTLPHPAAEVFALALVLETSVSALLTATPDDEAVAFPTGQLGFQSAAALLSGFTDKAVRWDGDNPVFTPGKSAWMAGAPDAPDVVKDAWAREDGT